jgi:hypothetical protein
VRKRASERKSARVRVSNARHVTLSPTFPLFLSLVLYLTSVCGFKLASARARARERCASERKMREREKDARARERCASERKMREREKDARARERCASESSRISRGGYALERSPLAHSH